MGAVYGMKPHATLTSTRPGKIRLTAALLLLAAPLAVAAWGLGGYAAQRERNNADARLTSGLDSAGAGYRALVSDADSAATSLANKPRVQHELLHGPSHVLIWRIRPSTEHPRGELSALAPSASGGGRGSQGRLPLEGTHGRPGRRLPASRPQSRRDG